MAEEYAQHVNDFRRDWEDLDWTTHEKEPLSFRVMMENKGQNKLDECISGYKMYNNLVYAKENDNKYLLSEDITMFPIMNTVMNEGPYQPPSDAVFGPEDRQVIIQGDKDLIFFQTAIDGLKRGRLVEVLV